MVKDRKVKEGKRIGCIVPSRLPYNRVMASTRLRVYDVIKRIPQMEMYNPFKKYDAVIFQKCFEDKHIKLAQKLKKKEIKVIFDINVNYLCKDAQTNDEQRENVEYMLTIANHVIVSSTYLKELYSLYNKNITLIEEMIDGIPCFRYRYGKVKNILWCGYAVKAKELYIIKEILKDYNLFIVSEKDPKLDMFYDFYKYNEINLETVGEKCDVFVSPRDLTRDYNKGHSFTRIGLAMSMGLPVIASPVPSYKGSPAILCNTLDEWKEAFKVLDNYKKREEIGKEGWRYVYNNFSPENIIIKYKKLLGKL